MEQVCHPEMDLEMLGYLDPPPGASLDVDGLRERLCELNFTLLEQELREELRVDHIVQQVRCEPSVMKWPVTLTWNEHTGLWSC